MGYLSERVSYLRGLADGMKLDTETNEGKLLKEIIELLDDIAGSTEDLEETQNDMGEEILNCNDRLDDLENEVFDDCCCCEDEDELECPYCGEIIELEDAELNEDCTAVICPSCGKEIEVEFDDCCDCEECDDECDCGCCHRE